MRKLTVFVAAIAAVVLLSAGSCGTQPTPQAQETERQQSTYERLTANQPAQSADYSPTRETINFWLETWGQEPGKLSYVYLLASNGQMVGYFIFEGLPVSYCASLTPTYRVRDDMDGNLVLPAPAMDGVYYSGGQCQAYYGKDAVAGSYMEYTIGNGISALVYEQPLPRQDVEPLGVATIENVAGR
jgi:hypothetical protein